MSSATESSHVTPSRPRPGAALRLLSKRLVAGVRTVAFWSSVVLPLAYLPLLYGIGVSPRIELAVLLLGFHLVSIVVGHAHRPGGSDSAPSESRQRPASQDESSRSPQRA